MRSYLFKGIHDRIRWSEELFEYDIHASHHFGKQKVFAGSIHGRLCVLVPSLRFREAKLFGQTSRES